MIVIFARTIIVFFVILILMRIMGKRQLGELELSELIVSVMVANLAAMPLQDIGMPLFNAVIPIVLLFSLEIIISGISMKSIKFRVLIYGKPCILIEDGRIAQHNMKKCRFTIDELMASLRSQGILDVAKVKYSVLETDGSLNTVLQAGEQPATASQLGIAPDELSYPYTIIDNGRILSENLRLYGRDMNWLNKQLLSHGVKSQKEVFTMIAFDGDRIYFEKLEEKKK